MYKISFEKKIKLHLSIGEISISASVITINCDIESL